MTIIISSFGANRLSRLGTAPRTIPCATSKPRRLPSARPSLRSTYIIILHSRARQVNISPKNYRILCIPPFRLPFLSFTSRYASFAHIPDFRTQSLMQKYKNIHKTALALFRHSPFCAYSPPKRPPPFYAFPAPRKTSLSVGKFPTRKEYFAAVLRPLRRFTHSSPQRTPQKRETPRHLCHGHSPKPHSSLSAMRSLPHSPRFYTHFTPKSTPFHKVFRIRQNLLIFDTFNF